MTKRKKILILRFANLSRQPRVHRQILFLKKNYNITTAGFYQSNMIGIPHIPLEKPINRLFRDKIPIAILMKTGYFKQAYWNLPVVKNGLKLLISNLNAKEKKFDLIIAHDPISLPLAIKISKIHQSKVMLDAHEYTPRQYEDLRMIEFFWNKFWDTFCQHFLPLAESITTVCHGIANEYQKNYGVHCEVINNAPFYSNLSPTPAANNTIRMIHHGVAHPSRRTEEMINLMSLLDKRFHLDFMLMNNGSRYYKKIVHLGEENPRISFRDTVPMLKIPKNINNYDIGLFLLSPDTFSYRMALPNKFFEFIQARLAVAIWPSPEMARLVKQYNCGIVSDDFSIESMAKKLNALSREDIMKFKMNSHKAASQLCAEKNRDKFLAIVERLIGS